MKTIICLVIVAIVSSNIGNIICQFSKTKKSIDEILNLSDYRYRQYVIYRWTVFIILPMLFGGIAVISLVAAIVLLLNQ